jgi:CelD/BcsL family acetyltransferase involved in cellulose biosynthesis
VATLGTRAHVTRRAKAIDSSRSLVVLEHDDPGWTSFLDASSDALPFHYPPWSRVLARSYGHSASVLALDAAGSIGAALPVLRVSRRSGNDKLISLPFTDYCPPVAASAGLRSALVTALEEAFDEQRIPRLQVRAKVEGECFRVSSDAVRHTLELTPDADAILASFKRSQVQRNIRRGLKSGLQTRFGTKRSDVDEVFYRLHIDTHRRLGVPVQPRRFFRCLWEEMLSGDLGFTLLVYSGDTPIAGGIFLTANKTMTYKYGASASQYWDLRPNYVLFWTAIRWGCEHGYEALDFGRSDLSNRGLRSFKDGWGTNEERLFYSELGEPSSELLRHIGRRMRPAIRRLPPWVTRGLGELFYRFAS